MSRPRPHARRSRAEAADAGFTLVEMIVVMLVLVVVLGVGATALARRDMSPTAAQSARQVQALLLQARSEAIRQGADTTVAIDVPGRRIAFPPDGRPLQLPEGTALTLRAASVGAMPDGRVRLVFRADGSASGAEVRLADRAGRVAGVAVDWFTGIARLMSGTPT